MMLTLLGLLALLGLAAVVVAVVGAARGGESGSGSDRAVALALQAERQRSQVAQQALREIAAGDEMPVFRASDALTRINDLYQKEIE